MLLNLLKLQHCNYKMHTN